MLWGVKFARSAQTVQRLCPTGSTGTLLQASSALGINQFNSVHPVPWPHAETSSQQRISGLAREKNPELKELHKRQQWSPDALNYSLLLLFGA